MTVTRRRQSQQTNSDDGLTVPTVTVQDPEAKAHKCHTLEVLSDRFDTLNSRVDVMQMELTEQMTKVRMKLAVTYAIVTILVWKVLGIAVSELGWCF